MTFGKRSIHTIRLQFVLPAALAAAQPSGRDDAVHMSGEPLVRRRQIGFDHHWQHPIPRWIGIDVISEQLLAYTALDPFFARSARYSSASSSMSL